MTVFDLSDDLSTSGVAEAKRRRWTEATETEFQMWRHQPITASYLQYLADFTQFLREAAADILEAGQFLAHDNHQDRNPDVLRGQIVMLRQLQGITLPHIQDFYGKETAEAETDN